MLEFWTNFSPVTLAVVVWPLLGLVLFLGAVAVVCPDTFAFFARGGGQWIDSQQLLQTLDKKVDIDEHVLRYSRVFGLAIILAGSYLGYVFYTQLTKEPTPITTQAPAVQPVELLDSNP